jgi:hypothetical protein
MENRFSETAVMKLSVRIHRDAIEGLEFDQRGWALLTQNERVTVTVEISPDAWRGIASTFSQSPEEPEWLMKHQRLSDENAGTPWYKCRPSTPGIYNAGPGGFMHPQSCYLSVLLRAFPPISVLVDSPPEPTPIERAGN